MTFIDLSHTFEERMPGFRLKKEDGTYTQFTAKIHPFLTRVTPAISVNKRPHQIHWSR